MENKTSKYFKYAIGEIVLVVIGILIALSINNWNEVRKDNIRKSEYISTLISDLKKDSIVLKNQNTYMQLDLDKIIDISERLSLPNATIDSVKHIYNYEFSGRFDPSNSLNKNTYNIIISTGDFTLFDTEFKNYLLDFYQYQDRQIQVIEENVKLNLDKFKQLDLPPKERIGIKGEAKFGIKGQLLNRMVTKHSDDDLLVEFNKFLTNKAVMEENLVYARKAILKNTSEFLQYLYLYKYD